MGSFGKIASVWWSLSLFRFLLSDFAFPSGYSFGKASASIASKPYQRDFSNPTLYHRQGRMSNFF